MLVKGANVSVVGGVDSAGDKAIAGIAHWGSQSAEWFPVGNGSGVSVTTTTSEGGTQDRPPF